MTPDDTDSLIERLSARVPAASSRRLSLKQWGLVGASILLSASLSPLWFAHRAEGWENMHYAVRDIVLFLVLLSAVLAGLTLARPGQPIGRTVLIPGLLAVVALVVGSTFELATAASGEHLHVIFGRTARECPFRVLGLGMIVMPLLLLAFRSGAPTHPVKAGLAAGLIAGSAGALIYAQFCTEQTMTFVTLWFGLGIALAGAVGAVLGPWTLRWHPGPA
jgi:hypothetical protein